MSHRKPRTPRWLLIAGGILGLMVVAKTLGRCRNRRHAVSQEA